jgi:hypothetical protein
MSKEVCDLCGECIDDMALFKKNNKSKRVALDQAIYDFEIDHQDYTCTENFICLPLERARIKFEEISK